ncbi:MAG TPA: ABC transporter permease [Cytophagaceae bacterium]|jgi:lipopolysaccharide transport system permease protein
MYTLIDSGRNGISKSLKELIQFKDLLLIFSFRDLKVKYSQTFLGIAWAFLQPIVTVAIFTIIFSYGIKLTFGAIPYPLFSIVGVGLAGYSFSVINQSSISITSNQDMVKKIYFPKIIIPISKAISLLPELIITVLTTMLLMIYFGQDLTIRFVFYPLFLIATLIFALAVGVWACAIIIRFRDFQHVIPFVTQIGMYGSPVFYSSTVIPEKWQALYFLNPLAGIIEGVRWSLFNTPVFNPYIYLSLLSLLMVLVASFLYFYKIEEVIADII